MLKKFEQNALQDGNPVILYGAAMYGELAFNALCALGIPVFAFCDRVQAGRTFLDKPVLSPEQLRAYPNAHVLICATKGFSGIMHYLESLSWGKYYDIADLLPHIEYEKLPPYCQALPYRDLMEKYAFYLPTEKTDQARLDLSFVALSITERCTLKCKKCSVLAPYYKHPHDDSFDEIYDPFQRFLSCVDSIAELQIGGGEPLMHKELAQILVWCLEQEKVKEISIFTNSTILPNESLTKVLMNPKIKLLLDDYGALSRKLPNIVQLCDERGIRYLIQKFERWDDLGDYSDKHETEGQLIEKFKYCSFGNVMSFMKGKLYRCTTAARIADLQIVPDDPTDYVDFRSEQAIYDWKEQIRNLICEKKYHRGCQYCNGISTHNLGIPVAEQAFASDFNCCF